ncbi:MAG: O-antigen ligase family protein [Chitinophagaceae bacterium]|nr:O-antigen ligase family protein [Chitinophagaceae bacterium]
MFKTENFLKYVLPMYIISPMITLGNFGFSLGEILTFFYGVMFLLLPKKQAALPKIVLLFFVTIIVARLGAMMNSLNYPIPFNYSKFIFLFILLIQIISYYIGRNSAWTASQIMAHKATKYLAFAVFALAVVYIASDATTRGRLVYIFASGFDELRTAAPRFPGLGINANLYAYFVFVFFLFSLKNYFDHTTNFWLPFFCFGIIVLCASKTVIILAFMALLVFSIYYLLRNSREGELKTGKRRPVIMFSLIVGLGIFVFIASQIPVITEYIIIFQRFDDLLGSNGDYNSLNDRYELWGLGLERVRMAPILGIDVVQADLLSDSVPLYFVNPHNEFIFYWMSHGILGLLAYFILPFFMMIRNCFPKFRLVWVLLYFSLLIQMMFDSAFQSLKFQFFIFLIIGLNFMELGLKKNEEWTKAQPQST